MKKIIALKPLLAEVDFHKISIEAVNLFFLKLFLGGFFFFSFKNKCFEYQ